MRQTARLSKDTILGDKYKIIQVLSGEGEENDLKYIAFDIYNPDKNVLIRELVFSISDEKFRKEIIEPMEERIKNIIKISHANLSQIFDIFIEEEKEFLKYRVYIVTEAEDRDRINLLHVMKEYKEDIPFDKIKEWGEQICNALSALHNDVNGPVIFYDLKPEHILFTDDGRIKLTDYGLSRMLEKGFSNNNRYMGTAGYSAPEQYGLKPVDARSDVFAFGALLYYLLTKEDPRNNPLKFSPLRGKKELGELATKCIEFNQDKRIQKIDEVRELLGKISTEIQTGSVAIKKKQKVEEEKTFEARPESFLGKISSSIAWNMKKFWYANMNQLIAIGAVILLCLAGVAILFATSRTGKQERIIIIGDRGSEVISMDIKKPDNLEIFKTKYKLLGDAILSRDGKYIYVASIPDLLCCFDLEKNQMATQIKVGSEPKGMSFSPVQNYLAVTGSGSDSITLVDTVYNNPVATLKSIGKYPVATCFSSDGQELFVVNKNSSTVDVMELTGNPVASIKIDGSPSDIINTGINNKIYLSVMDKNEILVIDGEKKQIVSHIKTGEGPSEIVFSRDKKLLAILCQKPQEVILMSLIDDKVIDKMKFQNIPSSMTFSKDGKSLFVGTTTFDHSLNYIYLWDLDGKNTRKLANPAITAISLIFVSSD